MKKAWTWVSGIISALAVAVTAHPELVAAVTNAHPKAAPIVAVIGIVGAMIGDAVHK